jgi:hypothetical protein
LGLSKYEDFGFSSFFLDEIDTDSTDPRDQVYALLAMLKQSPAEQLIASLLNELCPLVADYSKSETDVYDDVLGYIRSRGPPHGKGQTEAIKTLLRALRLDPLDMRVAQLSESHLTWIDESLGFRFRKI